jgi:hypothetical protein
LTPGPLSLAPRRTADERILLEPGSAWPLIVSLGACLLVLAFFLLSEREAERRPDRAGRLSWLVGFPIAFAVLTVLAIFWTQSRWDAYPLLTVATCLALRRLSDAPVGWTAALGGRAAALAAGLLAAIPLVWTWGSLDPIPAIHDEASYALQARIFAAGRWSAPSPPIPEFFEQMHVLVTPVFTSKYFPGHALTIAPGNWLGLPGLVPLLLFCGTVALLFLLARRLSGAAVAWIAVAVWITAGIRHFRPSFFSQVTTGFCLLLAWWLLLRWIDTARCGWLFGLAAVIAWGAVVRPYSMLLLSAPIGVTVLTISARRRRWTCAIAAAAGALPILALLPLWCHQTTGSWTTTPLAIYTRDYMPYDHLGFAPAAAQPRRSLPADLDSANRRLEATQQEHTARALPKTIRNRAAAILRDVFGGDRSLLLLPAIFGLAVSGIAGWFGFVSGLVLFSGYWFYWHDDFWTPYYLEVQPVLAYLAAVGVWLGLRKLFLIRAPATSRRSVAAVLVTVAILGVASAGGLAAVRAETLRFTKGQRDFRALVRSIPEARAVVFVRYSPEHNPDASLIDNDPILDRARSWIVYDRGAENARLLAVARGRTPYLYDEAKGSLRRLADAELTAAGRPPTPRP